MNVVGGTWPIPAIIVAAAIVSDFWRVLGALLASRIDESSAHYRFVKCVATALIAAIVAQLVVYPTGRMAEVPLLLRIGSMAAGFAAYLVTRRSLMIGTVVCEVVLAAGVPWA
jgi:branched-subunit amino acid transport protein